MEVVVFVVVLVVICSGLFCDCFAIDCVVDTIIAVLIENRC